MRCLFQDSIENALQFQEIWIKFYDLKMDLPVEKSIFPKKNANACSLPNNARSFEECTSFRTGGREDLTLVQSASHTTGHSHARVAGAPNWRLQIEIQTSQPARSAFNF